MTRGPQPSPNAIRRNRHEHAQELSREPKQARQAPLGLALKTAGAKRFWLMWSQAPQTSEWTETDWLELEITSRLVDALYQGDLKQAGEIRQRVAKWGATVEDRARLRMKFEEDPEGAQDGSPEAQAEDAMDQELYKLLGGK